MRDEIDDTIRWVEAAQRGDETAFEALVKGHYRGVWALAFATTGDGAAADDLAQETFLVAWTELGRLRTPGAFPMWIRTIARNLARNWRRSMGYRARLAERYGAEAPNHTPAADAGALRSERRERILAALKTLSPRLREVMVLFYLEERPIAEIAGTLGLTETAVKSRLFQGRNRLRDALTAGWERELRDVEPRVDTEAAAGRVMSGLLLGPAVPELGKAAAGSSLSMWWQETMHQGMGKALDSFAQGVVVVSTKKAVVVAVTALVLGAGALFSWQSGMLDQWIGDGGKVLTGKVMENGVVRYGEVADVDSETTADAIETTPEVPSSDALDVAEHRGQVFGGDDDADATAAGFTAALDATGDTTGQMVTAFRKRIAERNRIPDKDDYGSISGRVIDLQGQPIADALVLAFESARAANMPPTDGSRAEFAMLWRDAEHRSHAYTDGSGAYTITDIAYEGAVRMGAQKAGYRENGRDNTKFVDIQSGSNVQGIDFILQPGVTFFGKVIDVHGAPVTDAQIFCVGIRKGGGTSMGLVNEAIVDSSGMFFMTFDQEGVLTLEVVSPTAGRTTFDGIAFHDGDTAELVMEEQASLEGIITYPGKKPAAGVAVMLEGYWQPDSGRHRAPASVLDAETDANGYYRIEMIDPGSMYAASIASKDGDPLSTSIDLDAFKPGAARVWDYTVEDAIHVSGIVYGQVSGLPLRDIVVAVRRPKEDRDLSYARVNDDGSYAIDILDGPGEYHVFPKFTDVDPNEYGYPSGQVIAFKAGEQRILDLTMIDPVSASVRAIDPAGNPLVNLDVGVWELDRNRIPVAFTDADGRWEYHGFVPTVEIAIEVRGSEGQRAKTAPFIGQPGDTFPEQTLVLYRTGGLVGRALNSEGQPLARVELRIIANYGDGLTMYVDTTTNDQGAFTVTQGVPAVAVQLSAEGEAPVTDQPIHWQSEPITIAPDELYLLGDIVVAP